MIDWHRLFGLILTDFFTDSPFVVELEKDLSVQQQLLDVVVIRKLPGVYEGRLPDGFDDLGEHNLVTFKSYQEAFTSWSLKELLGHYVNYRKLISEKPDRLLPEEQFRLFAFVVRYPRQLAGETPLQKVAAGVYDWKGLLPAVRVIVAHELPEEEQNALCLLFSADAEPVLYASRHYQQHSPETSGLLLQLLHRYQKEGVVMPYTLEDFKREFTEEFLKELPIEKRLEGLKPEERLEGLKPEERLEGLKPEDILKTLPQEVIENYLRKIKGQSASESQEPDGEEQK